MRRRRCLACDWLARTAALPSASVSPLSFSSDTAAAWPSAPAAKAAGGDVVLDSKGRPSNRSGSCPHSLSLPDPARTWPPRLAPAAPRLRTQPLPPCPLYIAACGRRSQANRASRRHPCRTDLDYGETERQRSDREYQRRLTERLHNALDNHLAIEPKVWRKVKRPPAQADAPVEQAAFLFSVSTQQRLRRRAAEGAEQRRQKAATWYGAGGILLCISLQQWTARRAC